MERVPRPASRVAPRNQGPKPLPNPAGSSSGGALDGLAGPWGRGGERRLGTKRSQEVTGPASQFGRGSPRRLRPGGEIQAPLPDRPPPSPDD